ncbi:hypothetical protein D3C83_12380 [compost metagenome]
MQAADDEVHLFRHAEAVAAELHELSAVDERAEPALEAVAFVAGDSEQLRELAGGCGMGNTFADEPNEVAWISHATRITCKSPTFVHVGPVLIKSPIASKKAYVSLSSR